jgi:hypothetical protein
MLRRAARCCSECFVVVEQPDAAHPRELLASYRYCMSNVPDGVDQRVFLELMFESHNDALRALDARLDGIPHRCPRESGPKNRATKESRRTSG